MLEDKLIIEKKKVQIIEYDNSIITIYPHTKKLINVTNLKNLGNLYEIEDFVKKVFKVKPKSIRIDSIMLSRKIKNKRFSLGKVLKTLEKYKDIYTRNYEPELFHAPWFKSNGHGSFNLFSTGSCTVMGVKSINDIKLIEKILDEAFCKEHEIINQS